MASLNITGNTAGYCHLISSKEILHNNKGHLTMPLTFHVHPHLPKHKHLAKVHWKNLKVKSEKNPKLEKFHQIYGTHF